MCRLAVLLARVAVLCVVGTTAAAVAVRLAEAGDRGRPAATTEPPWQVVTGPRAAYAVPSETAGWTVLAPTAVVYYTDQSGRREVEATDPAVYDDGYCPQAAGPSNRGFVGFVDAPAGLDPRATSAGLADRLGRAVARDPEEPTRTEPSRVRTTPVVLHDAAQGARSTAYVVLNDRGPCEPRRVRLDVVSTRASDGVVTLALVRDLGPSAMSDHVADRILTSLRPYPRGRR